MPTKDNSQNDNTLNNSLNTKIANLVNDFKKLDHWEAKYEKLISLGKQWPEMDNTFKTEDLKVQGCQSQVWIKAELNANKKIIFYGDSDALLVKGLVAMVLSIYTNESPEDILNNDVSFLKEIGFDSGLSPSRSNGLYSMIKQIKYYATAFQYLLSK